MYEDTDRRIDDLEREVRTLNRALTGQRHYIKVAAEYKANGNDDDRTMAAELDRLRRQIEGMQAALHKAAEYEPRQQNGKRQRRRGRGD